MNKIITIISKEWAEVFKNRLVLFSVAFLPLIFVALPLISFSFMDGGADTFSGQADPVPGAEQLCLGLSEMECVQVYTLDIFTLMFMILPVMIPVTIAAYSIVGEKTARSLEPLLATPITTAELLMGKIIAAVLPAVAVTWLSFGIYAAGVYFMSTSSVFMRLMDPLWLIAIFVVGPLLTILAVCVAIMVSSRVTDPRVAEQLSGVVLIPLILLLVGQSVGFIILDRTIVLLVGVVVFAADIILVALSVRIFERESILTKWK